MVEVTEEYNFDSEFGLEVQKRFLTLLVYEVKWAKLTGLEIVKPEYFDNKILHNICFWIQDYYKNYDSAPTLTILAEMATGFVNDTVGLSQRDYYRYKEYLDDIFELDEKEKLDYFKDKAVDFAKQIRWKKAMDKASKFLRCKKYSDAMQLFSNIMQIGTDDDLGIQFNKMDIGEFLNDLNKQYDPATMIHTGIPSWDKALGGGFVKDNLHIIGACPGGGKSVSISTPVLTTKGWKNAGDITFDDILISRDGLPTKVLGIYPQGKISNYKVTFNDGSETNCCENHLWTVIDRNRKHPIEETLSLKEIMQKGVSYPLSEKRAASGRKAQLRFRIPLVKPVQFTEKKYIISPYNLGVLIGDGSIGGRDVITLTSPLKDIAIKEKFTSQLPKEVKLTEYTDESKGHCAYYNIVRSEFAQGRTNVYLDELRRLNLMGCKSLDKFIPDEYKFGSVEQRLELLRGLMDTDGSSADRCKIGFYSNSKQLVKDVVELVQSLGGLAHYTETIRENRKNPEYKVTININSCPFSLERKAKNWHETKFNRYIAKIEKQENAESVCFRVDNPDSLFVIEHYIVTHNSKIMSYLTKKALEDGKRVVFITLELNEQETMTNILISTVGMTMSELRDPVNREKMIDKITTFRNTYCSDLVVKFYKPSTITTNVIHNYIQKVIQRKKDEEGIDWKPDVIFLDYMDKLLPVDKIKGNIYEDNGGVADDCKNLAIDFECPVITGSQLGRASWNLKGDEVISMASIAESARKAHLAHSLTTINANPQEKELGKSRLYIAKSRGGTPGKVIYLEHNLGRNNFYEIEPWTQEQIAGAVSFSVKDTTSGGSK